MVTSADHPDELCVSLTVWEDPDLIHNNLRQTVNYNSSVKSSKHLFFKF